MSKPGPKPQPTAILRARNSWRGDLNKSEPIPPDGDIIPPHCMAGRALELWNKMVPMLEGMLCVSPADVSALDRYCRLYPLWQDLEQQVAGEDDYEKKSKRITDLLKISATLSGLEKDFGLTPSARSRIETKPVKTKAPSAKMALFERKGKK